MSRHRSREAGFALLDALVALAVFAVVTAMFVQVVHSSALARRESAERRAATLVAQSRLALVQETGDAARSGTEGGFRWRAEIAPYPATAAGAPPLQLVTVTVLGSATGRPMAVLKTLRLAR